MMDFDITRTRVLIFLFPLALGIVSFFWVDGKALSTGSSVEWQPSTALQIMSELDVKETYANISRWGDQSWIDEEIKEDRKVIDLEGFVASITIVGLILGDERVVVISTTQKNGEVKTGRLLKGDEIQIGVQVATITAINATNIWIRLDGEDAVVNMYAKE